MRLRALLPEMVWAAYAALTGLLMLVAALAPELELHTGDMCYLAAFVAFPVSGVFAWRGAGTQTAVALRLLAGWTVAPVCIAAIAALVAIFGSEIDGLLVPLALPVCGLVLWLLLVPRPFLAAPAANSQQ